MTDPALYPLSKNTVTDLVETIISINSAGQKAYPKHYWGMNKTPKEIAEKAVQSLLKFQMLVFDKLYAVNVDGDVQNIMFEKSPDGLFSNHFLEMLVYDLESTTVTRGTFMEFVDKDADAVKRDAAFVRDFLPKYNIFFTDAQYDNATVLTRVQNENAQQNQSASVGAEAYTGVSWLGLIGAKASLETASSIDTQTSLPENRSPYLSASERMTILTLASAYMLEKIHNIQHLEWPEIAIMVATIDAKKFTNAVSENKSDIVSLIRLYRNRDLIKTFNALQINNDFIRGFVISLIKYGYMEYLGKRKADPNAATTYEDIFWLGLSIKIENNSCRYELMEDEIQFILKYQKESHIIHFLASAINIYNMTDTALAELKTAISAYKIPVSVINSDTVIALNPWFTYCPTVLRANAVGYNCEPDNLVFFSDPYSELSNENFDGDLENSTGFIHIKHLARLFPESAKRVNFSCDNYESSLAFVIAVNCAISETRLKNSVDFIAELIPVSIYAGGIIVAHKIHVSYIDADGNPVALTPEGVRYSGIAQYVELTYPITELTRPPYQV